MLAVASDEALQLLEFTDQEIAGSNNGILESLQEELRQYFLGKLQTFQVPLQFKGTPFQMRVWKELQKIPYGTTISYATLAERIGQPTAVRAVARANGANKFAILVPCHRVIYANGGLGGYSGGLMRKPKLLKLEKP